MKGFDDHLDNYGNPSMLVECFVCGEETPCPCECEHPRESISYKGRYDAECQDCGAHLVTPEPQPPFGYDSWESYAEHSLTHDNKMYPIRIGLVFSE